MATAKPHNTDTRRAALRTRTRENQTAARARRSIARAAVKVRTTARSLATHVIATGAAAEDIKGAAQALSKVAKKLGIKGRRIRIRRAVDGFRARATTGYRYTRAQVAAIADAYKPRKAEYKVIRAALVAA
ncbi:hypothetical protein [Streptomyces zaomyceticus]|uniref:hypothetical protein n=1 Tax=Streptomyces zaomyceticus TaxID=68286 RepID=UPI002E1C00DA